MFKLIQAALLLLALLSTQTPAATTVRYQHTDILGSVVAETDAAANIISRSHYEPFGKRSAGDKAGISYTGHLQDEDLNLIYMQARYYDPVIGRFYSNDPVDSVTHLSSDNGPHGFNRYAYANNNPYKYLDPTGMTSWPVNKNQNGQVVVTSQFGPRNTGINGASKNHPGTDFRAGKGAEIKATENGTIAAISESEKAGNSILISNDDGSISGHAHTKASEGIKVGDKVSEGSVVGKSDGSGTGNAPHQHYTYRPGTPSNPATASTPKVDPMKTQFKDMPQKEVCVKGSGSC